MLPDDLEFVGFGDDGESAPSAMKLTDGIYILNHTLLAIVAVVLAFEVDDSYLLTYLVGTLFLLNIPKIISKTLEFLAPICYNNVLYTRTSGTTAKKGI